MDGLLHRIADGLPVEEPTALVVAHPDDETLGLGSRLGLFGRLKLIHLTDGAPRDLTDARREGCASWAEYAEIRERELSNALAALGAAAVKRVRYLFPDQEATLHAGEIVDRLTADLDGMSLVISHPYEHGHPDHDTAAFAVALACDRMARNGVTAPRRYEFASYHLREGRPAAGVFYEDPGSPELCIRLSETELVRKAAARDCFVSQRTVIANYPIHEERIRPAPRYDFRSPAPPGAARYDMWGWRMTSEVWRERAAALLADGRSAPGPCA